ncbi:MAG TPA: SIS domain-containing protein, partial [Trebonia sp.]
MSSLFELQSTAAPPAAGPVKFPAGPHADAGTFFRGYARELARAGDTIDPAAVEKAAGILIEAYTSGARMFSCGNGGSAAIANHMQCDHVKGIRTATDLAPSVLSLSTNVELLTAIANDIGYDDVFTYQLESQARP